MLVISGCYKSGWRKALRAFPTTIALSDCFSKTSYEPDALDLVKIRQPLTIDLALQGRILNLVTNCPEDHLFIADDRNTWLLDFWAEQFPEAKFLLFYSPLEIATANAFHAEIEPQQYLQCWSSTISQFLAFQRRNRQRVILLCAESANQNPDLLIHLLQQHGVTLTTQSKTTSLADEELSAEGLLAGSLLAKKPEVRLLWDELEASAWPIDDAAFSLLPTPAELFSKFLQKRALHLKSYEQQEENELLQVQLRQLKEELELNSSSHHKLRDENIQLAKERDTYKSQAPLYENVVRENELLLLQIRQIQEELEDVFLQKQQLEQITKRTKSFLGHGNNESSGQHKENSFIKKLIRTLKWKRNTSKKKLANKIKIISQSDMFDEKWYIQQYNDVAKSGINPAKHYLLHGAAEGRDPSPNFDTRYYLTANPDVVANRMNPLLHYISHGKAEGRKTVPSQTK